MLSMVVLVLSYPGDPRNWHLFMHPVWRMAVRTRDCYSFPGRLLDIQESRHTACRPIGSEACSTASCQQSSDKSGVGGFRWAATLHYRPRDQHFGAWHGL